MVAKTRPRGRPYTKHISISSWMPIRLTENVDRDHQLYRGRKGRIHGWTMAPGCIPEEINDELILHVLPLVVYIHFTEVTWQIGTLPIGVYPLKKRPMIWRVNKRTGIEARRTGFWFLADFGSTAHMRSLICNTDPANRVSRRR